MQVTTPAAGVPLQPGDVVAVDVTGEPEVSGTYSVHANGTIDLPMIGAVAAEGRTTDDLETDITAGLTRFVRDPIVSVLQVGGATREVSILGAVNRPGTYDMRLHSHLLSLLAAAGGPTREADLERAMLIRGDEPALVAAPDADATGRRLPRDVKLEAGDTVFIPTLVERAVRVVGAVANPGLAPLEEDMTVSRAVLAVGGPAPGADLRSVQLLRGVERISLDLRSLIRPDAAPADAKVRDVRVELGDIVVVPQEQDLSIHVIGAVNAPGAQPASEADRASKAVALAGGATEPGDLSRAYILREGARIDLDLKPLLKPGSADPDATGRDAPIEPGDVVVVPEARPVFVLGAVQQAGALSPDRARTVTQALFGAGGLTAEADTASAYVMRSGELIRMDLRALLEEGDAAGDIALQPEDALVVPATAQVVHVAGEVEAPGAYPVTGDETLVDLLGLAGSLLPTANTRAAVLLRDEESEIVDLHALIEESDMAENRKLTPGDTLLVPKVQAEAYLFGELRQPGPQPIHEGDTIIDVIARAGGPSSAARIEKIALIRRTAGGELPEPAVQREAREEEEEAPSAARRGPQWPTRRWERQRSAAPSDDQPRREERAREKIYEGNRSIHLFDLAEVREGDPAYLARSGDVIWIPPRDLRQSMFDQMLRNLVTDWPFWALF
ncbi:MAG: SLBB domain-containing protein [Armatimonadota bacterium]